MDFELWLSILDYENMTREQMAEAAWDFAEKNEREACAKVCETGQFLRSIGRDARFGKVCAAEIRSRSNA